MTSLPSSPLDTISLLPHYRSLPIHADLNLLNISGVSMLNVDVLVLLYHLARYTQGMVLELGAYKGGGSIAMGWGLRDSGRKAKVTSVELGGRWDHPTHGSSDILRDLSANLRSHGVTDYVTVVPGNSRDTAIIKSVRQIMGSQVDLLCIDSEGLVQEDLDIYRDLLAPRAYLVVDDYFSPGAPHKVEPTRNCITSLERSGAVQPLGIYGWGTWIGRFTQ